MTIDENTYLILALRYKELTGGGGGTDGGDDVPYDLVGYITEIDTGLIDSDYMNSRFDKYIKLLNAEGTTQESLEESVSSDGQSDSQAGGVGNEVSGNSNNSGSDNVSGNSSGNSSDSGNQSAQPDNGSDNSGELSGGSGSDTPANTKFKADGTYTGSAVCETYNYNVTVTIVISGDTITSVTAESEAGAQDVQYFNMANAKVPAQLLANQSTSGVDSVSGATKSSNAIKKAFYYAYKSAKK